MYTDNTGIYAVFEALIQHFLVIIPFIVHQIHMDPCIFLKYLTAFFKGFRSRHIPSPDCDRFRGYRNIAFEPVKGLFADRAHFR